MFNVDMNLPYILKDKAGDMLYFSCCHEKTKTNNELILQTSSFIPTYTIPLL